MGISADKLNQMEDSRTEMSAVQLNQVNVNANISDEVKRLTKLQWQRKRKKLWMWAKQFILKDSESSGTYFRKGKYCVQLINNTERQVWFLVLSSIDCDGIVAFGCAGLARSEL